MYDLSSKFNTFYKNHVVLPKTEQDKLHDKKELNTGTVLLPYKRKIHEVKTSWIWFCKHRISYST